MTDHTKLGRTYENGARIELRVLNPEEPCVSLRHIVYRVYNQDGIFAVELDDQIDAIDIAKSL